MNNFRYWIPTDIRFGKGQIECLSDIIKTYGKKILFVYGGGSIKRNGLYDKVCSLLCDYDIFELSGIAPNPKITSIRKGAAICKAEGINFILAVGGGSCIDAAKAIAASACTEEDPWFLVRNSSLVKKALPVGVVLTINATGSEMNRGAVITNEETHEKLELANDLLYPCFSICDPTCLYSLPAEQTAAGAADTMSHVFEQYFQPNDGAYLTDRMSEAVLKTVIHYTPIAINRPDDYEARSNLMWASTIGLNHLLTFGKGGGWSCHAIEHELSAYYDVTHGAGLAVITPAWMKYILNDKTAARFAMYARNVWNAPQGNIYDAAKYGIEKTVDFFQACGLPSTLNELGIPTDKLEIMAEAALRNGNLEKRAYVPLSKQDILNILLSCQ